MGLSGIPSDSNWSLSYQGSNLTGLGRIGGAKPAEQKTVGGFEGTSAHSGELSRAKQVGQGGYHNPFTGGTDGNVLDVNNNDLFTPKASNPVNSGKNSVFGNIGQIFGDKVFNGQKISTTDAMEMLLPILESGKSHSNGQNNSAVTGFQG